MPLIRTHITEQRDDVADMLKLLRNETLTVNELARELNISDDTTRRWLDTFCSHGIVVRITDEDIRAQRYGGCVPHAYKLAAEWGGR